MLFVSTVIAGMLTLLIGTQLKSAKATSETKALHQTIKELADLQQFFQRAAWISHLGHNLYLENKIQMTQ